MITKHAILFSSLMLICARPQQPAPHTITRSARPGASLMKYLLVHPLHEIEATCKDIECTIEYEDATHTIDSAAFRADVSCFDSGNSNRDSHAMEVLDALTYPTVSFHSKHVTVSPAGLQVDGDLTFHGQTRSISFPATTDSSGDTLTVRGAADVSLTDFSIDRPTLLMMPVNDTLRISFIVVFPPSPK
jgi:polyisoprenoid-binding protein YceI